MNHPHRRFTPPRLPALLPSLAFGAVTGLAVPASAQELNSEMIAYWKLDEIAGGKSPDATGRFDMLAKNLTETDVVPGRWGNAITFDAARGTILERIHLEGEDLPLEQHTFFTISMWVKGDGFFQTGGDQGGGDRRVFSEASAVNNNPLFNIGTETGQAGGRVDLYVRGNNGTLDHGKSDLEAFDDQWRHIVWVQSDFDFTLYVDGVASLTALADGTEVTTTGRPLVNPGQTYRVDNTSIGGIRRAAASHFFNGLIDDVALWKRALSAADVTALFTTGTPDPPSEVLPVVIREFKSQRPKIAAGDSAILSWDGSKDASFSIDQGVGDVDGITELGAGTIAVPVTAPTTFTLTATRGAETVTSSVTVDVLPDVTEGWVLLDDFETYNPGLIADEAAAFWSNPDTGAEWEIADDGGNKVIQTADGENTLFARLGAYEVPDGESRTAYFHFKTNATDFGLQYFIGLTNKELRGFVEDTNGNLGGFAIIDRLDVTTVTEIYSVSGESNDPPFVIAPETWYRVWLDITNEPGDDLDTISAYIVEDGGTTRTALFEDTIGDRGNTANLTYFMIAAKAGNLETRGLSIDNVFVSKSGLTSTDPLGGDTGGGGGEPFMMTGITRDTTTQQVTLTWSGDPDATYGIWSSVDLTTGMWVDEVDSVTGLTHTLDGVTDPRKNYRVEKK